jgi:DNA polymerase-3 subunit epsilon
MQQAIAHLVQQPASFVIKDQEAIVLVEKGRFYGMAMLAEWSPDQPISHLREQLTPYPENEVIRSLVQQFTEKYPEKVYPYTEVS